ncbi:MAG: hypothetical protein ABIY55_26385, partial [Kofleriaceae bacterium]
MTPLPSVAAVYAQMDQARRAGPLVTNFYPVPDKLQRSIERGELFSVTASNVLFVLRRDRDFLHLSFMAGAAAELGPALGELLARTAETVTVDLLGPRDRVAALAAPFTQAGFTAHATLERMTKVSKPGEHPPVPDAELVLADPGDAAALAAMLGGALDRHAEQ